LKSFEEVLDLSVAVPYRCSPVTTMSVWRLPRREPDELFAPIEHGRFDGIPSRHLGGVGLGLMLAISAPYDNRTLAAAALPSVIGGPGSDLMPDRRRLVQCL
jgi:hypothetical protein